jgi:hypothetical protein
MAKKALAGAPGNEVIRAAYQQIERSLFADLSRVLLTQYRVPTLQKSKDEIARTPCRPRSVTWSTASTAAGTCSRSCASRRCARSRLSSPSAHLPTRA